MHAVRSLHPLILLALALLGLAACDARYAARVLWRRDANTDDFEWKRTAWVEPTEVPNPWPEVPGCRALAEAFAEDPDIPPLSEYLKQGGVLAFVAVRDGTLLCEWYGNGGARDRPAAAFSVSKTVTSLLLSRAVAEGRIGALSDPITKYVPELARRDGRFSAITLAALVDMRSGMAFDEQTRFSWVNRDQPRVYYARDLARTVLESTRIASQPGPFLYNDYAPNLLGLALERAYGAELAATPMRAFWSALGSEVRAGWNVDDHGFAWHESGLLVTARDLARIGQLMLDDGKVRDRQVAPIEFLDRSFDPAGQSTAAVFAGVELGYRNGWWVPGEGELLAMGRFGQVMYVSRATRTVLVRLGEDGHNGAAGLAFEHGQENNTSIARRFQRVAGRLTRGATPSAPGPQTGAALP